jgi:hypothetical protein
MIAPNRMLSARKAVSGSAGHCTKGSEAAAASVIHAGRSANVPSG